MKIIRWIHTAYAMVLFSIVFILIYPLFLVPIFFPKKFKWVGYINRLWGRILFPIVFMPHSVEYRGKVDRRQQYIFCPNHFSYLDIATMGGLNSHPTIFVGKNDMQKIPLFGFMYRKLHIVVDRTKLKSRVATIKKSLEAIDEGKSLVIFPEGGIITEKDPVMHRFKDGAFRVAIEKQIPVVPVTIPFNWIILPPSQFLLHRHVMKLIFHEPIDTKGLTLDDVSPLREKVFRIIDDELKIQLKA